jgi:hypothetical protein
MMETADIPLIKDITDEAGELCPCPRKCGGKINIVGEPTISNMVKDRRLRPAMSLTGKQLYQAVLGMGLPDEIVQDPTVLDSLLRSSKVTSVDIQEDNGALFLHELRLENGCVVHLTSGLRGAQVLKITKGESHG